MASSWIIGVDAEDDNSEKRRTRRPKRVSFVDALKKKYCNINDHEIQTKGVVIVFHGKPKSDGCSELGYLNNVVLSNCNIATSGLDGQDLKSLCPNVVDLDISGNRLVSWKEILPVITQLANLKFLNLARNRLQDTQTSLQEWTGDLPGIENLVLNTTFLSWTDVQALSSKLAKLKELHLCGNNYAALPETRMTGLEKVECLRMNNNQIQSWKEVWKLRHLPNLKSLILSGNPLIDVFYQSNDLGTLCNQSNITDQSNHDNSELGNAECNADNTVKNNENQNIIINKLQSNNTNNLKSQSADSGKTVESNDKDMNESADDNVVADVNGNDQEEEAAIDAWCRQIICDIISELVQDIHNDLSNPNTESEKSAQEKELSKGDNSDTTHTEIGANTSKGDDSIQCSCDSRQAPFASLESLCLSETGVSKWKHLSAVRQFPALKSLRIQDVKLGAKLNREDRRKLFVASLPNIQHLNGSEITFTERDKSERHLLRHFSDKKNKPDIFPDLEKKHGQLAPLVDIDISRGYQEFVTVTFMHQSKVIGTERVRVREPVARLRKLVVVKYFLYSCIKHIKMYHHFCSPQHQDPGYGEIREDFEELTQDNLPISRYDIIEGDEIHFDIADHFMDGALAFLYMRSFMPDRQIKGTASIEG